MSSDELRPEARELLEVARRARTPSDARRERAYQSLIAGLGSGAALGTAKVAGKSAILWLKWAVPAALVAAGVGGYVWTVQRHSPSSSAPSVSSTLHATPPRSPLVASAAPAVDSSAPPVLDAAPEPSALPPPKAPAPARPSGDDLVQELSLLHQALAASRSGNAAGALALAQQHAQRYPSSRLRNERDAIEVRSLCALGRAPEARKIADRLRARAPNSPVSAALQDSCVGN